MVSDIPGGSPKIMTGRGLGGEKSNAKQTGHQER
jgi:hypothetical protein